MPLINILTQVAAEEGFNIADPANRQYVVQQVNRVVEDLYRGNDLSKFYREQYFYFDRESMVITFPWHVKKAVGYRNVDEYFSITTCDMSARYRNQNWPMQYDNWRLIGEVAIQQEMNDASKLTFTIPEPEVADINLIVVGKTANAQRKIEELTLLAGQTVIETTNIFEPGGIQAIRKLGVSDNNIIITESSDGLQLAEFVNVAEHTRYTKFQWTDICFLPTQNPLVECYYKHENIPMVNDYDSFIAGDEYDHAIYMLTMAKICSLDSKRKTEVSGWLDAADSLIASANNDYKNEEIQTMVASNNTITQALENRIGPWNRDYRYNRFYP